MVLVNTSIAIIEVDRCFGTPDTAPHHTQLNVDALNVVVIQAQIYPSTPSCENVARNFTAADSQFREFSFNF